MQDKIRSNRTNFELLNASEVNKVYRCFELIGIFEKYQPNLNNDDFESWYIQCVNEKVYTYRNIGVQYVYNLLEENYEGINGQYHISKTSMRRYGITYWGQTIKVYEGTYVVLNRMIEEFRSNPVMWHIYIRHIGRCDFKKYFDFQNSCMDEYIGAAITHRQKYYAQIREGLQGLIKENTE